MTLLAVLIIASIVGTIYESNFDAKVARAYIYQAPWFNFWLALLAVNLGSVAFSRLPWKKHHTGFLITHLGIIILLVGSIIGRIWGIEGTMTLFKDQPPKNILMIDQRELYLREEGAPYHYVFPLEILNRKPTPQKPRYLWTTEGGWKIEVVDYSTSLISEFKPKITEESNVAPIIRIKLQTEMMGQRLERWLAADLAEQSIYNLGLASIVFGKEEVSSSFKPSTENHLVLSYSDAAELEYQLSSRKMGASKGKLKVGEALKTGWADWTLTVEEVLTNAVLERVFKAAVDKKVPEVTDMSGIRLRATREGKRVEEWVPFGWRVSLLLGMDRLDATYTWKTAQLPIALELLNFEVERNEGTSEPASFKSHLRLTSESHPMAEGFCWMNHPANYPDKWWRIWTGLTYKISQASWNPENLKQSTVQILRDPGWFFKWLGSLLICSGIFTMFYLRPPRKL